MCNINVGIITASFFMQKRFRLGQNRSLNLSRILLKKEIWTECSNLIENQDCVSDSGHILTLF